MKKTVLRAYARLIAEVGARVQKGQDVVIEAELDQPEFVTMVADACYHAGARKVTVTWKHQALEKLAIRRESVKTLQTVEDWERAKLQHYVDTLPCRIYLLSEDPDGLRGVSPAKMASARQGTLQRHQALPRPDGGALPVVHCGRARCGMGEEGVPERDKGARRRKALGGDFAHLPCAR